MLKQRDVLLLGGDGRQTRLAKLLAQTCTAATLRVPGLPDTAQERTYEILVLPCPAFTPDGALRAAGESLSVQTVRSYADRAGRIFGGGLGPYRQALEQTCASVVDLLEDAEVLQENAGLTAEAALALTLTETQSSLCAKRCLVLGWGRIGKRLCHLLKACGARVTVAARSAGARAEAALYGFQTAQHSRVQPDFDLVFNTVPAQCLHQVTLCGFSPDCVWVELASAPGGLPQGAQLPLRVIAANALPGRVLPQSAAEVLYRGIVKHLG